MGEPGNPKQQGKLREDTGKPLQTQTICSLAAGPTYVSGGFASVQLRQLYPDAVGNGPDNSGGGMAGSRWRGPSCTQEGHTAGDKHLHRKTASSLGSSSRAEVSASNSDLQGLSRGVCEGRRAQLGPALEVGGHVGLDGSHMGSRGHAQRSHGKQPTSLDLEGRESSVALADFKRRTHAAPLDQLDCTRFCRFSRTETPSPGDFDHRGMMHRKMQSPGPAIAGTGLSFPFC